MIKILLFLWLLAYIVPIIRSASAFLQTRKGVSMLADFVVACGYGDPGYCPVPEEYASELTRLLRYYPAIRKYVSYPELKYGDSDEETFRKAVSILNQLQMKRNELRLNLLNPFNPLPSVRELILLPVNAVRGLGFQPGILPSLVLNAFGWLLAYLLGMFQPEIKALLLALVQQVVAA